jgi:Fe-S oxidoreductase
VSGVYDAPREILAEIPGLELVEMERIKEYSWCCGSGGGAKSAFPEFALSTGQERIEEAKSTGASAIVSACPWCETHLRDSIDSMGESLKVYSLIELVQKALA